MRSRRTCSGVKHSGSNDSEAVSTEDRRPSKRYLTRGGRTENAIAEGVEHVERSSGVAGDLDAMKELMLEVLGTIPTLKNLLPAGEEDAAGSSGSARGGESDAVRPVGHESKQ